jgi:hypothetical protein
MTTAKNLPDIVLAETVHRDFFSDLIRLNEYYVIKTISSSASSRVYLAANAGSGPIKNYSYDDLLSVVATPPKLSALSGAEDLLYAIKKVPITSARDNTLDENESAPQCDHSIGEQSQGELKDELESMFTEIHVLRSLQKQITFYLGNVYGF